MVCFALPRAERGARVYVWDFPTRVFHWSLVAAVAVAFITGFSGGNGMDIHGKAGVAIVGLVAFRLAWGFLGSTYARFATFIYGPKAVLAYLRGEWCGLGHNPLGALSVIALLSLAVFQVVTGLFGNDDIAFNGPLYALVDKATSDGFTGWHRRSVWLLLALIALHLGAIGWYARVKQQALVKTMLTGWQDNPPAGAQAAKGGGFVAFLVAAAIGIAAAYAASGAFIPPPPPPAAAPAW